MATTSTTTTRKKKSTSTTAAKTATKTVANKVEAELVNEVSNQTVEAEPKVEPKVEPKKPRQFNQNDLILCRSVTAGWLGVSGKSGQYYTFYNLGDECEIEYQDLFALKSRRSRYLYDPLFIIEDEELLENPRWADIKKFYDEKLYSMEDVDYILNLSPNKFKSTLETLPKGLAKTVQVEVAKRIEDGTFDSLKKINIIDEVFGTDFRNILSE